MNGDSWNHAAERISRDDPRFKCRMCGKPIFGVEQSDKNYNGMFYCSRDCELASAPICISLSCSTVLFMIVSEWIFYILIVGVPYAMVLSMTGVLIFFLGCTIISANQTWISWNLRREIIRNRDTQSKG